MKIMVSGLINIETTLKVRNFPINYYPIDYPFFGINSGVSGVAYNVAKALRKLQNDIQLVSFIGTDAEGKKILSKLDKQKINNHYVYQELKATPLSIVLYDDEGKRQICCDLKDLQDKNIEFMTVEKVIKESDLLIICNTNFNRGLLKKAKEMGKLIACDIHVVNDINDEYNKDFMVYADIIFFSDEKLPYNAEQFLVDFKEMYDSSIIVIGQGNKGALMYERTSNKMYRLGVANVGEVLNTLGAGDALFSCFLNYYIKGYSALESLVRSEIFAGLKIGYNGAAKGFCDEDVIEHYYQQINIPIDEI